MCVYTDPNKELLTHRRITALSGLRCWAEQQHLLLHFGLVVLNFYTGSYYLGSGRWLCRDPWGWRHRGKLSSQSTSLSDPSPPWEEDGFLFLFCPGSGVFAWESHLLLQLTSSETRPHPAAAEIIENRAAAGRRAVGNTWGSDSLLLCMPPSSPKVNNSSPHCEPSCETSQLWTLTLWWTALAWAVQLRAPLVCVFLLPAREFFP